jgi:hypothetical protein
MVREGRFTASDTVVFLHTGGSPLLFSNPEALTSVRPS